MTRARRDLAGGVALVTGAGAGIGAAHVDELVARGMRVIAVDVDAAGLDAVATRHGDAVVPFVADVRDRDAMAEAVDLAMSIGVLHLVVANAGVIASEAVADQRPDDFDRVLDVNVLGAANTIRPAIGALEQSRGAIVVTASIAAVIHTPLSAAYAASKAACLAFGNALRGELAPKGIDVTVASYGYVETDLMRDGTSHERIRAALDRASWLEPPAVTPAFAATRVADAVERRRAHVRVPAYLGPLFVFPAPLQFAIDRLAPKVLG